MMPLQWYCRQTEAWLAECIYREISGESSQPLIICLPRNSLTIVCLCLLRGWIRVDKASVQAFSEGERKGREGEKWVNGVINTWWFKWFDLVPCYIFLASWAILLWIGEERIFFSLATSFLPPRSSPQCAAMQPSPLPFLTRLLLFYHRPSTFNPASHVLSLFLLSPPQCPCVLRFNAPNKLSVSAHWECQQGRSVPPSVSAVRMALRAA